MEKVCLAPLSESIVPMRVDQSTITWGYWSRLKILSSIHDLFVGWTLVNLESNRILLRLMNLSHQQITLKKEIELAHCKVISAIVPAEVKTPGVGCVQRVKALEILPTHLRELHDHSIAGLPES